MTDRRSILEDWVGDWAWPIRLVLGALVFWGLLKALFWLVTA